MVFTDKNKEVLIKYTEPWNKIKNPIETINGKPDKFVKEFMKIKFNSGDDLSIKAS